MKKKVLFINFGGIGDEILFLPSIISFKKEFPDARVTLALEERSAGITDLTSLIDEVIYVQKSKIGMLKLLIKMWLKRFDCVVSSGSNKLISILLFLSGIKSRAGYDTGGLSRKLLTSAVLLDKNRYAVKMYHELVTPFTSYFTDLPEFNKVKKQFKKTGTILIHPGVSQKSLKQGIVKTISPYDWAELIRYLAIEGKELILTGGIDDAEVLDIIKCNLPKTLKYVDMTGQNSSLQALAELISGAEKFVCSDSAPLHIASGVGTKTFVFFGPTDYAKLIPDNGLVIPIMNNYPCSLRPCLWERRTKSCTEPGCLKFDLKLAAEQILQG